jgi:hypothetical protein
LNAGWDRDALALELGDLDALGFDLALTGFGGDELAVLIGGNSGLTDPDDVPKPLKEPVSRAGDLWLLGSRQLVCAAAARSRMRCMPCWTVSSPT